MSCPSKATTDCGKYVGRPEMVRSGLVEGRQVRGILLDTGCSWMLARQNLVPPRKKTDGRVSIRCAHGDVVSYVLANISMKIGGQDIQVRVRLAPNLPGPVLLGTEFYSDSTGLDFTKMFPSSLDLVRSAKRYPPIE